MESEVAELEVEIAMLPSAGQRRSNYRPENKHPLTGDFLIGEITFKQGLADPGVPAAALVRILALPSNLASLIEFGSWTIWEGPTHVGSVKLTGLGPNNSFKPKPLRGSA